MDFLKEVDSFFKKLEDLPVDVKEAAFDKIITKLPRKKLISKQSDGPRLRKKRPGRKPKTDDRESGILHTLEKNSHATEYVVQDIYTSRGRKAKRICYTNFSKFNGTSGVAGKYSSNAKETSSTNLELKHEEEKDVEAVNSLSGEGEKSTRTQDTDSNTLVSRNTCIIRTDFTEEARLVIVDTAGFEDQDEEHEVKCTSDAVVQGEEQTEKENIDQLSKEEETELPKFTAPESVPSSKECIIPVRPKKQSQSLLKRVSTHSCSECGKIFPQLSGLKVHMKRHRGQRDYPCDFDCNYRAYTKIDKVRHMTMHTGERSHMCQYCGKSFAKDSTLREHVKGIHERPQKHVCPQCGFSTYRANNLRVHISMKHRGEYNNHVCPVCGAKAKQRSAFLDHMRSHTGERPYKCDLCDSSFPCLARLTVHNKAVHGPREFTCEECQKPFQTKHHLLRHAVIHTNKKPFACPYCPYSCNTQGNITKHVKSVHNRPEFSYRKYKADQQIDIDAQQVKSEWIEKGQRLTEEYLRELSRKLGRDVTLSELQERQAEKNKRLNEVVEQVKQKRLIRARKHEHSYHASGQADAAVEDDIEEVVDEGSSLEGEGARQEESTAGDQAPTVLLSITQPTQRAQTIAGPEHTTSTQIISGVTVQEVKGSSPTIYTMQNVPDCTGPGTGEHQGMEVEVEAEMQTRQRSIYEPSIPVQLIYRPAQTAATVGSITETNSDPKYMGGLNLVSLRAESALNPTVVVIINTENT